MFPRVVPRGRTMIGQTFGTTLTVEEAKGILDRWARASQTSETAKEACDLLGAFQCANVGLEAEIAALDAMIHGVSVQNLANQALASVQTKATVVVLAEWRIAFDAMWAKAGHVWQLAASATSIPEPEVLADPAQPTPGAAATTQPWLVVGAVGAAALLVAIAAS